ncbi:MAG TPA: class I SAM-dependent methyltransferase [Candidatus Dojkabacteria bacterium]|nr:class I SAM-dependent methyltransferase [Candidatus Dojkabacteria bacterium]HNW23620.1 class I SAM-dependent methyltransferase [Candidatus Dojkabacteria bacterium]
MEQEHLGTYSEQSSAQIELIQCRYQFGLNKVEMLLPEDKKVTWVDIGSNLGIGISEISNKRGMIASDKEYKYVKNMDGRDVPSVVLDAQELPFESNSCDVISCFETIEHVPMVEVNKMLNEIYRVLKDGGILLISTPNKEANGKAKMSPDHKQEFTSAEFHMLLKSYGFKIQEEYGQSFIKENNLLHQTFRSLRENFLLRNIYYRLPSFIIKGVRNTSLNAFGKGEVRKKNKGEIERLMYFVCSK